jgi:uncharacterized protein YdaU (DUF1376 family)
MARTPPAFQFYVKDWLSSTKGLTAEAKGAYIDMLAYAWDNGPLPNNRQVLARIAGLSFPQFAGVWKVLSKKWARRGNFLVNNRMEKQRRALKKFSRQQAARGRLGGFPQHLHSSDRYSAATAGEKPESSSAVCSLQSAVQDLKDHTEAPQHLPVENSPPEHALRADAFLEQPVVRRHLLRAAHAELELDRPDSDVAEAVKQAAAQLRCPYDAQLVGAIIRAARGQRTRLSR